MKKIDSEYAQKVSESDIRQEFELLKKMDHPNVTQYFKYFYQDKCLYIIYEYVDNMEIKGLLKAYKAKKQPIETNNLWNIFMQCILSLNYIHKQNIIHRNINLNNVFMTENNIIKLGDFRLSFLTNIKELNKDR